MANLATCCGTQDDIFWPRIRLLSLGTVDIWDQGILGWGADIAGYSAVPLLRPPDASRPHTQLYHQRRLQSRTPTWGCSTQLLQVASRSLPSAFTLVLASLTYSSVCLDPILLTSLTLSQVIPPHLPYLLLPVSSGTCHGTPDRPLLSAQMPRAPPCRWSPFPGHHSQCMG